MGKFVCLVRRNRCCVFGDHRLNFEVPWGQVIIHRRNQTIIEDGALIIRMDAFAIFARSQSPEWSPPELCL